MPGPEQTTDELLAALDESALRGIVRSALNRHADVEREVRLVAARGSGDLGQVRVEVDRGLRTRRFLDYRASMAWAQEARPIVSELEALSESAPSTELVELLQRAVGHVVKVLQRGDDSSGAIGDVARELLDLHAATCDALVADPVKLAKWMVRFRFVDQDFFEADPVRYRLALGERGIAHYRRAVMSSDKPRSFAARYARERLAVLDGDIEAIVRLFGGDLRGPHQFVNVAEAMQEIGREDEVLAWTARGIAETTGWQTAKLYDLACDVHARQGNSVEVLALRRRQHEASPSVSTYGKLRAASAALDAWELERDAGRAALRRLDVSALIEAMLSDGDGALAWETAVAATEHTVGDELWLRLAETREGEHPADAVLVYRRVVEHVLETTGRGAYLRAVRILKRAADAARAAGESDAFAAYTLDLRERHRRRPTLIVLLDKARLP
ncbi:MAG: hypothetical protein H0V81_10270 [Solirubrobacterales bacterium]|nr:hypothetical protein [Solirubrobacterales bacterium]